MNRLATVSPVPEVAAAVVGLFRPARLNFAGLCFWCWDRWCSSPECTRRHEATLWIVCPACEGGLDPAAQGEPDPVLVAAAGYTARDVQNQDCHCYGGVVQVDSLAAVLRSAARYAPTAVAAEGRQPGVDTSRGISPASTFASRVGGRAA